MGTLFSALIDEWLQAVRDEADYEGVEGFLDMLRRVLELGSEFEPLTEFTRREPALALRILSDRSGAVAANADATIARLLAEVAPEVDPPESVIRAISVVSRTLVWANIATDQEPDVEGVIEVSRTVLESSPESFTNARRAGVAAPRGYQGWKSTFGEIPTASGRGTAARLPLLLHLRRRADVRDFPGRASATIR